jgi:hypothetical protein
MTPLLYVYAILPSAAPAAASLELGELNGINGSPVTGVEVSGLVAAVSEVPATEFETEPLNALVRSMDWLGPRAALHQEVNARLFAQTDALIPLAFGAIYRDRSGIAAMLAGEHDALLASLHRVSQRAEWVLSLQRNADQALAALESRSVALRGLRDRIADGAPGRAYLLARQVGALQRREIQAQDGQAVAALNTVLTHAEGAIAEQLEGESDSDLLARLSLLVRRQDEPAWLAAVEAYQENWQPAGYDLRLTGPWPPYRFSSRTESLRVGT